LNNQTDSATSLRRGGEREGFFAEVFAAVFRGGGERTRFKEGSREWARKICAGTE